MFARDVVYVPDVRVDLVTDNRGIRGITTPDRFKHGLVQVSDKKSALGLDEAEFFSANGERFNFNLGPNALFLRSLALLIEARIGIKLSVSDILCSLATRELEIVAGRVFVEDICSLIKSSAELLVRQDVYVDLQSEFCRRICKPTFKLTVSEKKNGWFPDIGSRLIGNGQNILRHYKLTDLVTCDEEE